MSAEVGKKAIDFVINNSGNRKNIEIDYFGGEPLMNFGVVKEITEYAKEEAKKHGKNFRFTVTTNGVLLSLIHIYCRLEVFPNKFVMRLTA